MISAIGGDCYEIVTVRKPRMTGMSYNILFLLE